MLEDEGRKDEFLKEEIPPDNNTDLTLKKIR